MNITTLNNLAVLHIIHAVVVTLEREKGCVCVVVHIKK